MRKSTTIIFGLAVALVVAAAAFAADGSGQTNAARSCRTERTAMGADAFKLLYGTNANRSNAFGKCVAKAARAEHQATANSSQACRTERNALGAEAFRTKYGTNQNKANAFGKCVSKLVNA